MLAMAALIHRLLSAGEPQPGIRGVGFGGVQDDRFTGRLGGPSAATGVREGRIGGLNAREYAARGNALYVIIFP
jgi:hypothetical protein